MRLPPFSGAERLLRLLGNGSSVPAQRDGASHKGGVFGKSGASSKSDASEERGAPFGGSGPETIVHDPWMPSTKALREFTPTPEGQPALHETWRLLETIDAEERKEQMIEELVAVLEASWRQERKQPLPRGASQEEIMRFMRDESVRVANATYRSAEASLLHEARQREAAGEAEAAAEEMRRVRTTLRELFAEVERAAEAYRQRAGEEQGALKREAEEKLKALSERGREIARRHEDAFDVAREHTQAFAETLHRLTERSERAAEAVRRRRSQDSPKRFLWMGLGIGLAALVILAGLWLLRPGWALSGSARAHLELGRNVEAAVQSGGAINDREVEALENRTKAMLLSQEKMPSEADQREEVGSQGRSSSDGGGEAP